MKEVTKVERLQDTLGMIERYHLEAKVERLQDNRDDALAVIDRYLSWFAVSDDGAIALIRTREALIGGKK
jgi:hypothetical protein